MWFEDGVMTEEAVRACEHIRAERIIRPAWDSMTIVGGIACRGPRVPWLNVCVGMGLGRTITWTDIERLIAWYQDHGVDARVELADRADTSVLTLLGQAGFRVTALVSVLAADWTDGAPSLAPCQSAGFDVRAVDPGQSDLTRELAEVITQAFSGMLNPPQAHLEANIAAIRKGGCQAFAAVSQGKVLGGGFLDCLDGVASLWGAAVAPANRRQGVQTALMTHRLRAAAAAGASLVCVETASGGPTHRNASRLGFRLAYSRMVLSRGSTQPPTSADPSSTEGPSIPTIPA